MDKIFWARLQMIPGIGSAQIKKLMDFFDSGEAVWKSSQEQLRVSGCLDRKGLQAFEAFRRQPTIDAQVLAKKWERSGIKLCTLQEEQYPMLLKSIYNPPAVLFYRGELELSTRSIAVVGSRHPSAYGCSAAADIAEELAKQSVVVVSGAARGIDTAAHRGALRAGHTIAVLGCGIDYAYPPENKMLLQEIAANGAVISEYPPGTVPQPGFFPARNRIISGLAQGTVVVEAAEKSGALITAEMALNEGRDVFAVHGSIYSSQSVGCNRLIQQGAKLICSAADVMEEYPWQQRDCLRTDKLCLSAEEAAVYALLSPEQAVTLDEIICKLRSDVSNIAFILLQMQLRGLITEYAPRQYIRAVKEDAL